MIEVVAAIIFNDEGLILLARRRFHSRHGGKWEFPGGKVEEGETYEEALSREIFEEFEVKTEIGPHFRSDMHRYDNTEIRLHSYFAKILDPILELNDHEAIAWVKPDEMTGYDFVEADMKIVMALSNLPGNHFYLRGNPNTGNS